MRLHVRACACVYLYVYVYFLVCMRMCMCIGMRLCMYVYVCVCVCVACKDHTWIHVEFPATEIGDLASVSGDAMVVRFTGLGSGSDS